MIVALLLAQASAVDAERAFAADAQKLGQRTAFRKWAADDAVMFVPQPTNAHEWLKDRKDPAEAVEWWPTASWVSCDGTLAVNTGGSRWPDGRVGYFTTVWKKQADGQWRWIVDHGDNLSAPRQRVAKPSSRRASCSGNPGKSPSGRRMFRHAGLRRGGTSMDGTVDWGWRINSVRQPLPRWFYVEFWSGRDWELVISEDVKIRR